MKTLQATLEGNNRFITANHSSINSRQGVQAGRLLNGS